MKYSPWLQGFIDAYSELGTDNLELLEGIYHPQLVFIDPLHQLEGVDNLIQSFKASYTNISHCNFTIDNVIESGDQAAVYWHMDFSHNKLNGGKVIQVSGHSHLKQRDGLVVFHRDYLDVGAMLYEHIPLLGAIVKRIKSKAVQV